MWYTLFYLRLLNYTTHATHSHNVFKVFVCNRPRSRVGWAGHSAILPCTLPFLPKTLTLQHRNIRSTALCAACSPPFSVLCSPNAVSLSFLLPKKPTKSLKMFHRIQLQHTPFHRKSTQMFLLNTSAPASHSHRDEVVSYDVCSL